MIKLIIPEDLLYPNAVVMAILFLFVCAFIGWCWKRSRNQKWVGTAVIIGIVILTAIFILTMVISQGPDYDEIEHAHAAWQMSQGLLPYTDFFQHHSPVFWLLLVPIFKIPGLSGNILEIIRIISTFLSLITIVIIVFMTKYIWKDRLSIPIVILFVFTHSIAIQLYNLRPDLLANVFGMAAFFLIIRFRNGWSYGISGILFGLILSLSPKYLPFIFVLPLIMCLDYKRMPFYLRYLPIHLIGIGIGFVPLIVWLYSHNQWHPFYKWVWTFNVTRVAIAEKKLFGGEFQFFVTLFALLSFYRLIKSKDYQDNRMAKHLIVIFFLSACVYLRISTIHHEYYEQMYVLCASVIATGYVLKLTRKWIAQRRTIFLCVFIGILIWPYLHKSQRDIRIYKAFFNGRKHIQTLQKLAENETVICIPPYHPIYCHNTLDITNAWQYRFFFSIPDCRDRMSDTVDKIIDKKPAIILNGPDQGFIQHLLFFNIISPEEAEILKKYLDTHYCLARIQNAEYWIRKDRYELYNTLQNEFHGENKLLN